MKNIAGDSKGRSYTQIPRKPASQSSHYVGEQKVAPQPIGEKCNPLCPLFMCGRNALFVVNKPFKGRVVKAAQCRLTGGECIGGECQYSSCKVNSLLPDNRCAKALEKKVGRVSDEELFKQMMQFEEYDVSDFKH